MLKNMARSLLNSLLLSIPLLVTPLFAIAQSNTSFSFSSAQFCTLDDAGQVDCVLAQGFERLQPPSNLPALTAVTTGDAHACGISVDGQPVCWGDNFFGQLNAPVVDAALTQIDAGANHTCALDENGEAICWGLNTNLQLDPPAGLIFTQVDAGAVESCGIVTDGGVVCWSDDPRRSPQDLSGPFVKIDLRSGAVCGLTADGRIQCADPSAIDVPLSDRGTFISPPDNGPYIDIATSFDAVCGLQSDGTLDCTFRNTDDANDYPIGEQFSSIQSNKSETLSTERVFVNGSFTSIISGTAMCGERLDGSLQCWDEGAIFPGFNVSDVSNAELVATMELDLDARIYGSNSVEIFWTPLPIGLREGNPVSPIVEVFRNGELIDNRRVRFSHFDSNALTEAEYQIRLIDEAGNAGPLSGILSVNTDDRTVLFNGEPTLAFSPIGDLPNVFTNITSRSQSNGVAIAWEVNADIEDMIDGYQIRVDGEAAGFTRSKLFVNVRTATTLAGVCIEIRAIDFEQSIIGSASFTVTGNGCA